MDNNLETLEYVRLSWEEHNFNESSMEKLRAMLDIRTEGNVIYICHPRHVFDSVSEEFETKRIRSVAFASINIDKMLEYNDFGSYSIVEQICQRANNQYTYVLKKASHMIKKYQKAGETEFSYPFAIIEEVYNPSGEPTYFARGIINCDREGFSLAFNPLAIKCVQRESIWQKGLRFGDNK